MLSGHMHQVAKKGTRDRQRTPHFDWAMLSACGFGTPPLYRGKGPSNA